jgi:hypothetical protein
MSTARRKNGGFSYFFRKIDNAVGRGRGGIRVGRSIDTPPER